MRARVVVGVPRAGDGVLPEDEVSPEDLALVLVFVFCFFERGEFFFFFSPLDLNLSLSLSLLSRNKKTKRKIRAHLTRVGPARVRRHGAEHRVPLLRPVEPGGRDRGGGRLSSGRGLEGGGRRGGGGGRKEKTTTKRRRSKRRVCFLLRRWR